MRTFLIYLAVVFGLSVLLSASWPRDPWDEIEARHRNFEPESARQHDYGLDICGLLGAVAFLGMPYVIVHMLLDTTRYVRPPAPQNLDNDPAKTAAAALGFDADTDDLDGSTPVFDVPARRIPPMPPTPRVRFALFRFYTAGILLACTLGVAAPSLAPESAAVRYTGFPFPAFYSPGMPTRYHGFYLLGVAANVAIFSCLYLAAVRRLRFSTLVAVSTRGHTPGAPARACN